MTGSLFILQATDTEGNVPQRLSLLNFEVPSKFNPTPEEDAKTRLAMVIDLKKCLLEEGCDACSKACHTTHNVPQISNPKHEVKWIWKEDYEKIITGREYFGDFDPFGDFDLLFGASKLNLKFIEIPIRYRERMYGSTQISRFRHGMLLLKMTFFALKKIKLI